MNGFLRYAWAGVCLLLILLIGACNARLYTAPPQRNDYAVVDQTLDHFAVRLDEGLAREMQGLFPEGYYFSYVLYGLARTNLAQQNIDVEENLAEAQDAYQALASDEARSIFSPNLDPPYGIFYQGWRNYLLAQILAAQSEPDKGELALFEQESAQIAAALTNSPIPFLSAYPGQTWPVDTFPAVASLQAHEAIVDGRHNAAVSDWLAEIDVYRDPETGLLPHKIDPENGQILDGARATSQSLILRFMAEIDSGTAQKDYAQFRDLFVVSRLGFPGVLEYPKGIGGIGDVDSGPLITGVSLSATAVMLGTARAMGDESLAQRLWQSAETVGVPISTGSGRYYLAALPFEIGNVFAAWSASSDTIDSVSIVSLNESAWRLPFHLLSLAIGGILAFLVLRIFRRDRKWGE